MARRRRSLQSALCYSIPAGSRVLACVSGGRDSMAMLHGLLAIRRRISIDIGVCHIDHGLRPCSSNDLEFVREFSEGHSIPFHGIALGTRPPQMNMEAWAREERYKVFANVLDEQRYDWCLTAHNANDVAETLVMRLLSNKEAGELAVRDERRRCLRPLAGVSRAQIDEYVTRYGVPFREDPTNSDLSILRNRVRHKLMPVFAEEFGESTVWSLSERAEALAEDQAALDERASELAAGAGELRCEDPEYLGILNGVLDSAPEALRWRVVERILLPYTGYPLGRRRAMVIAALFSAGEGMLALDGAASLRVGAEGITVLRI